MNLRVTRISALEILSCLAHDEDQPNHEFCTSLWSRRLVKSIVESIYVVNVLSDGLEILSPFLILCMKGILKESPDFVQICLI